MPMNSYSVRLKQVVEEFNLIVARESSDYDRIDLMVEEVMRPGLPLAGFFTHFEPLRLQVIGNAEATYLHSLTPERPRRDLRPALLLSHPRTRLRA